MATNKTVKQIRSSRTIIYKIEEDLDVLIKNLDL